MELIVSVITHSLVCGLGELGNAKHITDRKASEMESVKTT